MTNTSLRNRDRLPLAALACAALLAFLTGTLGLTRGDEAQGADCYVRIEEDWLLQVNEPDGARGSPQVATQMTPGLNSSLFCVFQINHRELSEFEEGGLQVQIWRDQDNEAFQSAKNATLDTRDETVTWTQSMERDGASLRFVIKAGTSTTWGDLADAGLTVSCPDSRQAFTSYASSSSAEKSGISFGANRVRQLVLVEVRKYTADGTCDRETTPRIVYQEEAAASP